MKRCAALLAAVLLLGTVSAQDEDVRKVEKFQEALVKVVEKASKAFVNFRLGSGVCISEDGLVVTNDHVARHARGGQWTLGMPGGKRGVTFKAKILWRDPFGDIALLKMDTRGKKVPYVELGDSDALKVGQFVFALGTPFMTANRDNRPTVTFGIISVLHRNMGNYSACIQTDCPVNPGNSGGPLLDTGGRLLGINGQIRVRFPYRVNTGIGLAVPVARIKRFMKAFKGVKNGSIVYHGTIKGLKMASARGEPKPPIIESVEKNSTAEKAGFKGGDAVLKVDDYPIFNNVRFWGCIYSYPEGWEVKVTVRRGAERKTLTVKLDRLQARGRRPVRPGPGPGPAPEQRGYLGVVFEGQAAEGGGAKINRVKEDSPAAKAGLKEDDVVTALDGKKIKGPDDALKMLWSKKPGDVVKLTIRRGEKTLTKEVKLGKRP